MIYLCVRSTRERDARVRAHGLQMSRRVKPSFTSPGIEIERFTDRVRAVLSFTGIKKPKRVGKPSTKGVRTRSRARFFAVPLVFPQHSTTLITY